MGLHDRRGTVDVHYQSGQEVAFAVDKPERGIVGADEFERVAELPSLAETFAVEIGIDRAILEGKDADGDAPYLGVPDAEELVLRGIDGRFVAFFYAFAVDVFNMMDGTGEDPRRPRGGNASGILLCRA